MAYSDKVVDHYENPRNVGSLDKSDASVGTGMVGAPACGDVMKLQIKVGAGVWGGLPNAGFTTEPTNAEVMKGASKWPVNEKKSFTTRYGFSFAKGPFGPQQIDGVWNAKIVIKSKVVARGKVTVSC